VTFQF
jgi:hypothetical protein